jgi:hypothetical protein
MTFAPLSHASIDRSPNRRGFVFLALAVALGIVIAGAGFYVFQSGALSPKHSLTGTIDLSDTVTAYSDGNTHYGTTCSGAGGYSDIKAGMPVTVKDESGKILGATSLGTGTGGATLCTFAFTIAGVGDATIYSVEAGRRGAVSYPKADLEANGWTVGLTIGS